MTIFKRRAVTTTSNNIIQFEGIHDSEILGLMLSDDRSSLEIKLKTEAGVQFKIFLLGIKNLFCTGFATQNVVFRMFALSKVDATSELDIEANNLNLSQKNRPQISRDILDGKLYLFQIDPSVGCEISCICERVEIES